MSNSLRPQGLQHSRLACPSPTLRAYSKSCPSSQWTYCRYIQLKRELLDWKINQRKLQITTQRNKEIENVRSYRRQWSEVKAQSCPTLCNTMFYTVHGILEAIILVWVAFPFSRGSSQHRDQTQVSLTAGGFFTSWATREAQEYWSG